MTILVTIVHIIVCLILIIVILVQGGRGQGLTGPSFGSGNVQSLFGTGAADFLTKATSTAAILFLFTCIGLDYVETRKSKSLLEFSRKPSQVDIDSIKKALERVKKQERLSQKTTSPQKNQPVKAASASESKTASTSAPAVAAGNPATPSKGENKEPASAKNTNQPSKP